MIVLVVDDQASVVGGILSGVNWESVGISKVLYAYHAERAREILDGEKVDILLTDIEMPTEDGLSLFRWARGRGMELECIFLTSHADFMYAAEALKLGSFDYLLQPARYEDVCTAVGRAADKIRRKREEREYYTYGKAVYHNRDLFLQSVCKDWLTGDSLKLTEVLHCMEDLSIFLFAQSRVRLCMVHLLRWHGEPWESDALEYALSNICTELLARLHQGTVMMRLHKTGFLLLAYPKFPSGEAVANAPWESQLVALQQAFSHHLHGEIACYTAGAVAMTEAPALLTGLEKMSLNNVSRQSLVAFLEQSPSNVPPMLFRGDLLPYWKNLIVNGCPQIAEQEILDYLNRAERSGSLNQAFCTQFCGDFVNMLLHLPPSFTPDPRPLLSREEMGEAFSKAGESLQGVECFVHTVLSLLENPENSPVEKDQIGKIVAYIQEHLSDDIRRSDIADAVYLNPDYLSRIFRKEKGVSLKEYILCEKMKTAQAILRSTNLPVAVVASRVGFENTSYFSQVYKKIIGVNPSVERQEK